MAEPGEELAGVGGLAREWGNGKEFREKVMSFSLAGSIFVLT